MQKLIKGIHQFQTRVVRSNREFFARLASGQSPETLFITCSDSRVNPNLITQTDPGELFILRNAGNIVPQAVAPSAETATIEYAITALGVREIVVCGHLHCGAIAGLMKPELTKEMPFVRGWLEHASRTREIVEEKYQHLEGDALLNAAVQENVLVQLEQLRTHPAVHRALEAGRINLHGWVYKIETGGVFAYDPDEGQFLASDAVRAPSIGPPRPGAGSPAGSLTPI